MKATSKLISVVLILAMCLSLFTVSAFADGPAIVIGGDVEVEYNGAAGGSANVVMPNESGETEVSGSEDTAAVPAASSAVGSEAAAAEKNVVAVVIGKDGKETEFASLRAAIAAAEDGDTVKLCQNCEFSKGLVLGKAIKLDLNGKTLRFDSGSEKEANLIVMAKVSILNGKIQFVDQSKLVDSTKTEDHDSLLTLESSVKVVTLEREVPSNEAADAAAADQTAEAAPAEDTAASAEDAEAADSAEEEKPAEEEKFFDEDAEDEADEAGEEEAAPADEAGKEEAAPADEAGEEEAAPADEAGEEEAAPADEAGEEEAAPADEAGDEEAAPADEAGEEEAAPADEAGEEEAALTDEADETPVNVVKEEAKVYEEEVRVDENAENEVVVLEGRDEASGAVVVITGTGLPENLSVVVKSIPVDEASLQEGERSLLSLDISLVDENGMPFEPSSAVSVEIKHPVLGNLSEEESVKVYHVVDEVPENVTSVAPGSEENAVSFSVNSLSPFNVVAAGNKDSVYTGADGESHKRKIKITNTSGEIYVKGGSGITFSITGGSAPESVSIIDPDNVSSGILDVYKAGYLLWDTDYTIDDLKADPMTLTIKDDAVKNAPTGKWAIVFWYKDTTDNGSTRVYMVQYVTIVPKAETVAVSPVDENGNIFVEKCDYDPVEIQVTGDVTALSITKGDGKANVAFDLANKKVTVKTTVGGKTTTKTYHASECYEISDYVATDAMGHTFVAGKSIKLYDSLIKKLPFGSDYTVTVTTSNVSSTSIPMTIVPGIAVKDGLNDYIKGQNVWIEFVACAPIDYDDDGTLAIWIGGQKISHDYYSISDDHMHLWIYRNLLDQLKSNNSYTLTARLWSFSDPTNQKSPKVTWYPATAQFNILAAGSSSYKSPKTGDDSNVALWAAVLVLSGGAVVALIPKKKKIRN